MAVNKVEFGGNTLIDLTNDTVTPETLLSGITAHSANGKTITGIYMPEGKYYASQLNPSSNVKTVSYSVGFEPKLFVIACVNNIDNSSTSTYLITTFWHCADLTGAGYGQYSGGLAIYKSGSTPRSLSYDARSYYSYSNGTVSINDASHYFASGKLYRVFAMA